MKISEMTESTSLAAGNEFPVVDGGNNKKVKLATLKSWLFSNDNMTINGNYYCASHHHGYYLKDYTGFGYPGVYDNGTNLWYGAIQTEAKHHTGKTYISSGYDPSIGSGNPTVYISVPNDTNTDATNYSIYHSGHKPSKSDVGLGNVQNINQSKAIKSIKKSGNNYIATHLDGTTSTF